MVKAQRALLPPEDEERLRQLLETGSDTLRQRAQAILAWHEGASASDTARRTRLSANQVQYLWRIYKQKGLDLFMVDTEPTAGTAQAEAQPAPAAEPEAPGTRTLEAMCAEYGVDLAHARHVGALAAQLFDATQNVHRLPQNVRPLLEAAALVHNVAYEIDQPNHHLRGRDIVMAQPIRGFTDDERRILACTTSFHRKKVRPEAEPVYLELPEELRRDALALSALLRVADGLDNSQTQSTQITDVQMTADEVLILVDGPNAQTDAEQAQKKADMWAQVFPVRARITRVSQEAPAPAAPILKAAPTLNSTMSVTRASRAFALHTLERIEALTAQLGRSDATVLPVLARESARLAELVGLAEAKEFRKETRWWATTVEGLRIQFALADRAHILADEGAEFARAIAEKAIAWKNEAQQAVQALDLARFRKMADELRAVLVGDIDPNENQYIAYHIGTILWEDLTNLRGVMEHGTNVSEAMDSARRLQDHLAAFRNLLGPEIGQVMDILSPLENYLTAIATTQAVLAQLEVKPARRGRRAAVVPDLALEAMRSVQMGGLEMLADDLPSVWAGVNSPVFRRAFALAIAAP